MQLMKAKNTIFIDVDGTLLIDGQANKKLVAWLSAVPAGQFEIILWSSRGKDHAEKAARFTGTTSYFAAIISKPNYIIDNDGLKWVRLVESMNHVAFECS